MEFLDPNNILETSCIFYQTFTKVVFLLFLLRLKSRGCEMKSRDCDKCVITNALSFDLDIYVVNTVKEFLRKI